MWRSQGYITDSTVIQLNIALHLEFPSSYLLCANRSLILNVARLKCDSFTIITEAYNVHFLYETEFIRKTAALSY